MTTVVKIRAAKKHLSSRIQQAAKGEEVIITRRETHVARLVPIVRATGQWKPGSMKRMLIVGTEFFESLPADE